MKLLLSILILSLVFSSFIAVAEARCAVGCGYSITENDTAARCAGHQKDADKDNKNTICVDCHHCCSSQAINIQSFDVVFFELVASVIVIPSEEANTSDYISLLLRPPKSLV